MWVMTLSEGDETDSRSSRGKQTKAGRRVSTVKHISDTSRFDLGTIKPSLQGRQLDTRSRVTVQLKYPLHPSLRHSINSMLFSFHRRDATSASIAYMRSIRLCTTRPSSVLARPVTVWPRNVSAFALLLAQPSFEPVSRKWTAANSDSFASSSACTSRWLQPCFEPARVPGRETAAIRQVRQAWRPCLLSGSLLPLRLSWRRYCNTGESSPTLRYHRHHHHHRQACRPSMRQLYLRSAEILWSVKITLPVELHKKNGLREKKR
jgi:hypothetical protein